MSAGEHCEVAGELAEVESGPLPDPDVELMLGEAGPRGRRATRRTVMTILTEDPRWVGRFQLDTFQNIITFDGRPLNDTDLTRASCWMEAVYQTTPSRELLQEVAACVAEDEAFHPVRAYLKELHWDRVERSTALLSGYLGVQDSPLVQEMGRAFLVGAVARVLEPGCKQDTMLVLIGAQGAGKSRFCRALVPAPSWFGDTPIDLRSKDAYLALQGKWIYELAEMEALRGRSATRVKSFLSSPSDTFRAPYDRATRDYPRQCVFIGTSNHPDLFDDGTGSRRFWPVEVGEIAMEALVEDRDQLWAEAMVRYQRGEPWHLAPEVEALRESAVARYQLTDPHREQLEAWLVGVTEAFTTAEAITRGLGIPVDRVDRSLQTRIGPLLHELGCIKHRVRQDRRREWRWMPPSGQPE